MFEQASYFCGACSCEIKNQNPGVDLLIAANWEGAIAGSEVIVEKSLPSLPGIGALSDGGRGFQEAAAPANESDSWFSFSRPWVVAGGCVLLVLGLGSVLILRKN